MRRVLAQHVQLPLEPLLVKPSLLALLPLTIVLPQDDERLEDLGLLALGARSEDAAVRRDLSPAQNSQTQPVRQLGERLDVLESVGLDGREEEVADGVVAWSGELVREDVADFASEELVGNARHDSGSVSVSSVSTSYQREATKEMKRSSVGL